MADQTVIEIIQKYGLIAIFFAVFLEYACFPVPSEIVLPLSGAVAAQGGFTFLSVYLICIAAGLGGSLLDYSLARWGGVRMMEKLERRFPKLAGGLEVTRQKFEKYAAFSVGICRVIPLCGHISLHRRPCKAGFGNFFRRFYHRHRHLECAACLGGLSAFGKLAGGRRILWKIQIRYAGDFGAGNFRVYAAQAYDGEKEEEAIAQARERRKK